MVHTNSYSFRSLGCNNIREKYDRFTSLTGQCHILNHSRYKTVDTIETTFSKKSKAAPDRTDFTGVYEMSSINLTFQTLWGLVLYLVCIKDGGAAGVVVDMLVVDLVLEVPDHDTGLVQSVSRLPGQQHSSICHVDSAQIPETLILWR